jgi:dienelactone hydrolase
MKARIRLLAMALTAAALVLPLTASAGATGASADTAAAASPSPSAQQGTERGTWRVRQTGPQRYVVSWTSPARLPIGSDRPVVVSAALSAAGAAIGVPTVSADGRTVSAVVSADRVPQPGDLDVVLSGRTLDDRHSDRTGTGPAPRASSLPTETLPDDPGAPGPHAIVTSDYTLAPVKVARMAQPIEMIGHVVEPDPAAVTGPRPLVLFMHGRHNYCYTEVRDPDADLWTWPCVAPAKEIPGHLGYDYIQRRLASQGYATVSIRVNGINAQDGRVPDAGAGARASLVIAHLQHWTTIAADHQVDLDQVVLVGHSRGGEGVNRAAIRIPPDAPYRIAGQVLLAPTDFGAQTAPYVPTVTVLPYCDGDVSDLQGQQFTDVSRDLTTDDTSLKSSLLVMGANHNYFNTEWTPGISQAPSFDDWYGAPKAPCGKESADRLRANEQRKVGRTYVAGAVRLFTGEGQYLPLYDGSAVTVASVGDADVRSHALGGGRETRRPGVGTTLTLPQGAQAQFCTGVFGFENRFGQCGRQLEDVVTPHWSATGSRVPTRRFFEMAWTAAGQRAGMALDAPLDLSSGRLELRTIVDAKRGDARLDVRLTDADGASVVLTPEGGGLVPALLRHAYVTKLWAQTVVVDTSAAAGVDLTRIAAVELVSRNQRGRVWVADLSRAPAALAAVPDRRLPTVSVSSLKIVEGNAPGTFVAHLPYRVQGDVSRPMRVSVVTVGQERGAVQAFAIDIPAGQTSGSVPVSYTADQRDDYSPVVTTATMWATRNAMTDAYVGDLRVEDDDPTPRITVTPRRKTVREGQRLEFVVRLEKAADYDLFLTAKVLHSPQPLRAGDVPASWLERYAPTDDPEATLASLRPYLSVRVRSGVRRAVLSIPVRADGTREGRESLRVLFRGKGQKVTRTVYVARS